MKLSACYIVKDAGLVLGKSLQSLKGCVDEIVVVDTGSLDATIEIAQQGGAQVYNYSWQDDFAAARNFALGKVSGEWIVFLDADEYFSQETAMNLRGVVEMQAKDQEVLLVKIINIDTEQKNKIVDAFFAPRIFKKDEDIYYVGKIHEQLTKKGQVISVAAVVAEKKLCIYHTGYSSSKLQGKAQRNLQMLLAELQTTIQPEKLYMYLAEAYDGIGQVENAMHYAKSDIAGGRKNITYASRSYRILLRLLEQQAVPDAVEILQTLEKAVRDFPELPEFHAEYAQYLAETFEYESAINQMQKALQCYVTYSSIEPSTFDEQAEKLAKMLLKKWKQIEKLQQNITLSACVITKNEAGEIGRWIDSMQQCTDEQILVDTGSTDETVVIAAAAGVKVYHYEWENNFAAAKNFAIEKATGDWIVFLDADETFTPDTVGNVRQVIAREHPRLQDVDAIMCPIINIDTDQNNMEISRFVNLRMFRNVPYLRYTGNVHEGIRHKGAELRIHIEKKDLKIYHTGYSSNRVQKKLERNLKLLQDDIRKNGEGIQHYRYLMDCYQGLGEHEKAIKYAKLHLNSNAASIGTESDIYRTLINSMVFLKKKSEEIRPYLEKAIERFSDIPDFYAYYAADFFRQGDFLMAKKYLLQALDVYQHPIQESVNSTSFAYILSEIYSYLGEIFLREGNIQISEKYIDLSLTDNPYNVQAFKQLCHLLAEQSKPVGEIVAKLAQYYNNNQEDMSFIVEQLEKIAVNDVYFYYAERLEKQYNRISYKTKCYRLLAAGKNEIVYQETLQQVTDKMRLLAFSLLSLEKAKIPPKAQMLLPKTFWQCIQRYQGMKNHFDEDDIEGYILLLPTILQFGNAKMIQKFTNLGKEVPVARLLDVIRIFCEQNYWAEAGALFDRLFTEAVQPVSEAFRLAGICWYYCGDFDKAEEYLHKAQQESKEKDILSYLIWIAEKRKHRKR
jgi:glycosyltransferase involved in cell wall biosynthesis